MARVGAVPRQLPFRDAARHGARVRKCGDCSRKRTGEVTCLLLTALSRGCSSTSPAHRQNACAASAITVCNDDMTNKLSLLHSTEQKATLRLYRDAKRQVRVSSAARDSWAPQPPRRRSPPGAQNVKLHPNPDAESANARGHAR